MERDRRAPEESLLDWHLDRLDSNERSSIEEALGRDGQLRAKSDRLGRILQPLDHWLVAPGRQNLPDKVLAHIERSTAASDDLTVSGLQPEFTSAQAEACGSQDRGLGRLGSLSIRELVAIAACIILLVTLSVPGVSELRNRSQLAMCAGNLGSIFRGIGAYQQAFAGSLPFAGSIPGASWLPGGAQDRPYASNSRHLYLLVRLNYGPKPAHFVCPAAKTGEPMRVDAPARYNDFALARNISYDSLNLAGPRPNLNPPTPIAYIGDVNPLFVGARFNESVDPDNANSPAHRGKGQTVLTLDGSASWMPKPTYGPKRDNLWLIGDIRRYSGIETPTSNDDVQLVPGYPATDPLVYGALRQ